MKLNFLFSLFAALLFSFALNAYVPDMKGERFEQTAENDVPHTSPVLVVNDVIPEEEFTWMQPPENSFNNLSYNECEEADFIPSIYEVPRKQRRTTSAGGLPFSYVMAGMPGKFTLNTDAVTVTAKILHIDPGDCVNNSKAN